MVPLLCLLPVLTLLPLFPRLLNCGNNVSEGVASTLINEQGFSPSTTNFINMSVADNGLECLKQAVAVEGITLENIVHATSKVVHGTMYDIVLSVGVTAGAKIGGKPVSNSPTKGKAQKLVQVYAIQNENNTLSFSSRIYPGKISDFDKLADSVASQASSMAPSWAMLTVISISPFLDLVIWYTLVTAKTPKRREDGHLSYERHSTSMISNDTQS